MKFWQILVIIIVITGIAGGSYWGYHALTTTKANTTSSSSNKTLATAKLGTITNTVTSTGNVVFTETESLTFGVNGISGTIDNVYVTKGQAVKKGDKIADLDDITVSTLKKAITQAEINLENAETAMDNLVHPYTDEQLAAAQTAIDRAQEKLTDLQNQAPLDIATATNNISTAQDAYDAMYLKYANSQVTWVDFDAARIALARAKLALEQTKRAASENITDAQTTLQDKKDALAEMQATPDTLKVALAQYNIDATKLALVNAQDQLNYVTLTAPYAGIITSVSVESGENINAASTSTSKTVVATIMDPSIIDIQGSLDEADAPSVAVGQKATVTFDALDNITAEGTVYSISSSGTNQSGVVTYTIDVRITPLTDVNLLSGMSATAEITTEAATNIVEVPSTAVNDTSSSTTVTVYSNGEASARTVTVGITDGTYTEITSGLSIGEQVVISTTSNSASGTSSSKTTTINSNSFGGMGGLDGNGIMPPPGQ